MEQRRGPGHRRHNGGDPGRGYRRYQSPAKSSFQSDWIAFFFSYAHW